MAVISRSLAERHWRDGQSPLDRRITLDDGETWITIVGVAGDVRDHGLDREPPDQLYQPFLQGAGSPTRVLVRARADPLALSGQVRDAVHAVDPEQPVENFRTLAATRAGTTATRRLSVVLLGLFAVLALVITVTGIAAVIATSVSRRTREFGLRLALGAERASILTMVLPAGAGPGAGWAGHRRGSRRSALPLAVQLLVRDRADRRRRLRDGVAGLRRHRARRVLPAGAPGHGRQPARGVAGRVARGTMHGRFLEPPVLEPRFTG